MSVFHSGHTKQQISAAQLLAASAVTLLACAACALSLPSLANAGEVKIEVRDVYVDTGDEAGCGRYSMCGRKKVAVYTPVLGEVNHVTAVSDSGNQITIADSLQTLTAGSGCTSVSPSTVSCDTSSDDTATADVDFRTSDLNDTVELSGKVSGAVDAGSGNDLLKGAAGELTLSGGGGTDQIVGGSGRDWITDGDTDADANSDSLDGGGGQDTLVYTTRTHDLKVNLSVASGAGAAGENDHIQNFEVVQGGNGNDELTSDVPMNNSSLSDRFATRLFGNNGNDRLVAGRYATNISGGNGNDSIIGSSSRDYLNGDGGNDQVNAGADNDVITGGTGNDSITGGRGRDRVEPGTGQNKVFIRDHERDAVSCANKGRTTIVNSDLIDVLRRSCNKVSVRR